MYTYCSKKTTRDTRPFVSELYHRGCFLFMPKRIVSDLPAVTPASNDILLLSDVSDSLVAKNSTIEEVTKAGMSASTSDDLPEGVTNRYMTPAEKTKLTGITPGADVSPVSSVNGQTWPVSLTQDNIPSGATYVQTENNYSTAEKNKVTNAYTHAQQTSGNPHNVTATEVWLGNVTNDAQLTRWSDDWVWFPNRFSLDSGDRVLVEDSTDGYAKKKVPRSSVISSMGAVALSRVTHSITMIGGALQLVNDEATPDQWLAYMTHQVSGAKWRHSPLPRVEHDELLIPEHHQYIVYGWIDVTTWIWGMGELVVL